MSQYEAYVRTSVQRYLDPDKTTRDVCGIFSSFNDLRPKLEPYVFNDGSRKELLCLEGTVPVMYKGNQYNIPIAIWLMDTHPQYPPLCFVKPTTSMQIRPSRHVDANGRVYLPYLHEWKHPTSDLIGLIQIMCLVFGEEPPVYARRNPAPGYNQPQPPTSQPPTSQPTQPPPYMPMPSVGGSAATNTPYPSPYPTGAYPSYPTPNQQYPPNPQMYGGNYPTPTSTATPTSYPTPGGYPPTSVAAAGYPPTSAATNNNAALQQQSSPGAARQDSFTEEAMKASLLSAVEEKMKRRLKEVYAQAQAELDVLRKTQEDLNKGKAKLEGMTSRLDAEIVQVQTNIDQLKAKDEEIDEAISKLDEQENLSIDEAIVPTAPLYRQLFNSFAEENATEDAIYYVGEGLRRGVIDLDVFLKQVRSLSREQFMLRATMQKCRQKAGLDPVDVVL